MSRRLSHSTKVSSDPAANVEISYTADEDMIVLAFNAQLVTDAGVANREVRFTFEDADGNVYFQVAAIDAQVASTTHKYVGFRGARQAVENFVHTLALPEDGIYVPKNGKVKSITLLREAGDNWGVLALQVARA